MSRRPTGKVALAPTDWRSRLLLSLVTVLPALLFAELAARSVIIFADDLPFGMSVLVGLGFAAVVFGAVVLIHAITHPTPVADFDSAQLTVGIASIPFSEIDDARIVPSGGRSASRVSGANGVLRLGRAKSPSSKAVSATVPIEPAGRGRAGDLRRAALLVVLVASSIRMPSDPYDPSGRFSHYNFPENLDKEEVIELVEKAGRADGGSEVAGT